MTTPREHADDKTEQTVTDALRRAFSLGKTYWQQAHSDFISQHVKADATRAKFQELCERTEDTIDNLRAQLAEAQKDSDRLDWIEQNANMGVVINRLKHITDLSRLVYEVAVDDVYATEDTLRAAIDAARGRA